jgi:hypothetical protein
MIVFALISIIAAYTLCVIFFKNMARKAKLNGIFYMFVALFPIVNFIVALILFAFNSDTAEKFFE